MTKATTPSANSPSPKTPTTKTVRAKAVPKSAPVDVAPTTETTTPATAVATAVETVAVETVVETAVETETAIEEESMKQRFERLIKSRQTQIDALKREMQDIRKMQRDHELAIKEASKKSKKKKTVRDENNPRKPSGFASPVVVSDDLYTFLSKFGVTKGDPVARTDVTRYITSYIKEHDLQNPEHRREIVPDADLKKLFGPAMEPKDANDPKSPLVYTYLKLQRYLSQHFPKKK